MKVPFISNTITFFSSIRVMYNRTVSLLKQYRVGFIFGGVLNAATAAAMIFIAHATTAEQAETEVVVSESPQAVTSSLRPVPRPEHLTVDSTIDEIIRQVLEEEG